MATTTELQAKIDKLSVNMDRLNLITNGNSTTEVAIDSGTVPSIAKFIAGIQAQVNAAISAGSVSKAGDTMGGDLYISKVNPTLILRKTSTSGQVNRIIGQTNTVSRWLVDIGDATTESGTNVGSDLSIHRLDNAGTYAGTPFQIERSTGITKTNEGFKWIRCILLPQGTNFDTVLESGTYDCSSPLNGPYTSTGWFYLEVIRHSGGTDWAIQKATALTDASGHINTWIRRRTSTTWSAWKPLSGFVTPEHYGALGDGNNNDTTAVTYALRSGFPVNLLGLYRINNNIIFGDNYSGGATDYIQGAGKRHFILDGQYARLDWVINTPVGAQGRMLVAKDIVLVGNASNHDWGALNLSTTGGSSSTSKTFDLRNIITEGYNVDTTAPLHGITLANMRNGILDGCKHQGNRANASGSRTGIGVYALGTGDPGSFHINNQHAYFCSKGIEIQQTNERISITDCRMDYVDNGIRVALDENPIDGDNMGKPTTIINGGFIRPHSVGVTLERAWSWKVTNVDFHTQSSNSFFVGIASSISSTQSQQGWIDGCSFRDLSTAGGVSSNTTRGIYLQGHTTGNVTTRIGMNFFILLTTGIYLDTQVRSVRYSAAAVYEGVVTPVANFGGGTNTSY